MGGGQFDESRPSYLGYRGEIPTPGSVVSTVASERDLPWETPRKLPYTQWSAPLLPQEGLHESPWLDFLRSRLRLSSRSAFRLIIVVALLLGVIIGTAGSMACVMGWHGIKAWSRQLNGSNIVSTYGSKRELVVHDRSVWVYMPQNAAFADAPLPAVFVLHGSGDTPEAIARNTRFEELSEMLPSGFLVVYPEMKIPKGPTWGFESPHEMSFFKAAVDAVGNAYPLSRQEVYVVGHSVGGSMALFLQNNMPDVFQAAAAVEAGVAHVPAYTNHSFGRPSMVIWNHNDNVLAEYGGDELYRQTLSVLRRFDPSGADAAPARATPVTLPTGALRGPTGVLYAEHLRWPAVGSMPPLEVVSWASASPTHHWANPMNIPGAFDAAPLIWNFFRETTMAANRAT